MLIATVVIIGLVVIVLAQAARIIDLKNSNSDLAYDVVENWPSDQPIPLTLTSRGWEYIPNDDGYVPPFLRETGEGRA